MFKKMRIPVDICAVKFFELNLKEAIRKTKTKANQYTVGKYINIDPNDVEINLNIENVVSEELTFIEMMD